jgi:hypothetical protein
MERDYYMNAEEAQSMGSSTRLSLTGRRKGWTEVQGD